MFNAQSAFLSPYRTITLSPGSLFKVSLPKRQISDKCLMLENDNFFVCDVTPQLGINI